MGYPCGHGLDYICCYDGVRPYANLLPWSHMPACLFPMGLDYFPRLPVAMSDGWNGEKAIEVTGARWPLTKLQSGSTW